MQRKREGREGRRKADEKEERNYQDVFSRPLDGKIISTQVRNENREAALQDCGGLGSQPERPGLEVNTGKCSKQGNSKLSPLIFVSQ